MSACGHRSGRLPRALRWPSVGLFAQPDFPRMTITYDPKHPKYFDEADVRNELTRVFDVCQSCRLCINFYARRSRPCSR